MSTGSGSDAFFPEAAAIERLRSFKVKPERDLSLTREFLAQQVHLRRLKRATSAIALAWNQTVPQGLLENTALRSLSAGVLVVVVPSASDRFELDRFLRTDGLHRLRAACSTPIRRVKIELETR